MKGFTTKACHGPASPCETGPPSRGASAPRLNLSASRTGTGARTRAYWVARLKRAMTNVWLPRPNLPRHAGFTLVEMLVALFVFALLSAAGALVLRTTASSQDVARSRIEELAAFQRLRAILKSDLSQAAPRRTRDAAGRIVRQAFAGDNPGGGQPVLRFVRRGWENPDSEPRASLQQVEYRLSEGRLERASRLALDGGASGPVQIVAEGVRSLEIAFLFQGQWIGTMPAAAANPLPQAVRLDLDLERIGRVRQILAVSGAPE